MCCHGLLKGREGFFFSSNVKLSNHSLKMQELKEPQRTRVGIYSSRSRRAHRA